jgi:DNA-binding Lrp family transcriptional regulator
MLDRLGVTKTVLSVDSVPYYLGHNERKVMRPVEVPADIDKLLLTRADQVSDDDIKRLTDSGVTLGIVIKENHLATGRIRAYVSITLREALNDTARSSVEEKLTAFNNVAGDGHAMPVVSLYRMHGRPHYLLELICDDQAQLDAVTITLLTLDHAIDNTETIVVAARYVTAPELYSAQRIGADERTQQLKEVVDKVLGPISDQLLAHVSEMQASQFLALDPQMQLRVLSLYQELTADSPYLDATVANPLYPMVVELVAGIIEGNTSRVTNAALTAIRDHVERLHLALACQITETIFDGDDHKWQSTLKTSNSLWKQWGLRVWGERIYPAWNQHALLQYLFKVEGDVLDSLRILGDARNRFAHYRAADLTHVIPVAREVFNQSYKILRWIDAVAAKLANPVVPFQAAASMIAAGKHGRDIELLASIRTLRVDLRRLAIASTAHDGQLSLIVQHIQDVADGVRALDSSLLDGLSRNIVPLLPPPQRGAATAMLETLKGSVATIPAGIASSLLAAMVATALKFTS